MTTRSDLPFDHPNPLQAIDPLDIEQLPLSEQELFVAYRRLVGERDAAENARKVAGLAAELQRKDAVLARSQEPGEIRSLVLEDRVLASLSLASQHARRRIAAYKARQWALAAANYRRDLLRAAALPENGDAPPQVRDQVERFRGTLEASWNRVLTEVSRLESGSQQSPSS
jgi:hypothetical protein